MIKSREELLNALYEAAELEHQLLCIYLFAAFSLKDTPAELPDPIVRQRVRDWQRNLLRVAKQEMGHLGTVCNLLTIIGGSPQLERPNLPQPAEFYPPEVEMSLDRFGMSALRTFVEFERSQDQPGVELEAIAPERVQYRHVGELYAAIREAFATLDEAELFIGPSSDQDVSWGNVEVHRTTTRQEAIAAIADVQEEGEGSNTTGPRSHYQVFYAMAETLREMQQNDPAFDPARPVASNPMTRLHRDNGRLGTLIESPEPLQVAELFNTIYGSLLHLLAQYYAYAGETADQRNILQSEAMTLMVAVIRPLGIELTRLPIGPSQPDLNAGPGFENYGPVRLPSPARLAWRLLVERFERSAAAANQLRQAADISPAIVAVLETVQEALQSTTNTLRAEIPNLPA
jgi:hypothetical protein